MRMLQGGAYVLRSSLVLMAMFTITALGLCSTQVVAEETKPPQGFIAIFNTRDTSGWRGGETFDHRKLLAMTAEQRAEQIKKWTAADQTNSMLEVNSKTGKPHWYVENGELVNDGFGAYASTEKDYGDFELFVEYNTVPKADSGVYLRGVPQVQIWDSPEPDPHGIGKAKGSGGLWNNSPGTPGKDPMVLADKPFGEWNKFHIVMKGAKVTISLNGMLVVDNATMENFYDRTIGMPEKGPIQLQTHGGEIRWRNIFIRDNGVSPVAKVQ